MSLVIGTTMICLAALWFVVLLIHGRRPNPPWWANDWMLGDIQVPLMMTLAIVGIWFASRFPGNLSPMSIRGIGEIIAAGVGVFATVMIIRQMKVKRRLRLYEELAADNQPEERSPSKVVETLQPYRKLPWQVRLHLADTLGYDLDWIRKLRCVVREVKGQPGWVRFIAFRPDQARERGIAVQDFEALAAHPELVIISGTFEANGPRFSLDAGGHPRVAA